MRWDNLRLDEPLDTGDGEDLFTAGRDRVLPLIERGAVARTFDTPGFRGMTFFEVQARSVVNRVPEASRMPFRWTINPYRGCQHACVYCLEGETPILMADGRTRPLAEVRVGDGIYGRSGGAATAPTSVPRCWRTGPRSSPRTASCWLTVPSSCAAATTDSSPSAGGGT